MMFEVAIENSFMWSNLQLRIAYRAEVNDRRQCNQKAVNVTSLDS